MKSLKETTLINIKKNSGTTKGFIESHYVKNYWWIFNLQQNEKGYVTPR